MNEHSEKPMIVSRCRRLKFCDSAKHHGCKGCNIWNYLYDIEALQEWCRKQGKDFMLFTMEMQRELKEE